MSGIVSRTLNNLKENLFYGRIFIKEILLVNLFFFILLIVVNQSVFFLLTVFLITAVLNLATLNSLGKKRKEQIRKIQSAIDGIRLNKLKTPDEVKLGKQLFEIEADIKAMFLRTQTDIANLKKLEQVRTEFLGNVSHELRTPIFAIQGYLETLMDGAIDDPKVNKNFLSKAIHHTNNLNNLLHDLIDISMIESGQMRMSFRYFTIGDYLENLVNDFKLQASEKHIELIFHPVRKNLKLFGDRDRLKQAIVNLLSNAIKYTEQGKVEVIVEEEEKHGKIIVRDTGIGLSEEDMKRVFERFYRVDKDRSRAVGGTGLGLAIVKHIVEAHDSKVEVKSTPGKGSEFSFRLKK